ncbi:MAG: hypothetical protein ACO30N_04245 [Schleiferiaceae bacterium]
MRTGLIAALLATSLGLGAQSLAWATLNTAGSARWNALAGAAWAHPADIAASTFNPSLAAGLDRNQLSLSTGTLPSGLRLGHMSLGFRRKKWHIALGADYLNSGLMPETNEVGAVVGEFRFVESRPRASVARAVALASGNHILVGATARWTLQTASSFVAQAITTDWGATYVGDSGRFHAALVLQHAGLSLDPLGSSHEPLPTALHFAVSRKFRYAPFRVHLAARDLQRWDLSGYEPLREVRDPLTGTSTYNAPSWSNLALRHVAAAVEAELGGRLRAQVGYDFRRQLEMQVPTRRTNAGLSLGFGLKAGKSQYQWSQSVYHVAGRFTQFSYTRSL